MRCKLLLPVFVALFLTGCFATTPQVIKSLPPVELLQDCATSEVDKTTNGGLAQGILDLRKDIKVCNNDKAALRDWAEKEVK